MSTRIFNILALSLALTACENRPDNQILADAEQRAASRAGDDGKVECAIDGARDFARDCYIERLSGENGVTMIIRHPDGGFRRFPPPVTIRRKPETRGPGAQPRQHLDRR